MFDLDPAPQGFESRCTYCGKPLVGQKIIYETRETEGRIGMALHFCSEAHAEAYRSLTEEEKEEFEESGWPGPT